MKTKAFSKQFRAARATAFSALLMLVSPMLHTADFEVDSIYYNITNPESLTCEVTYETKSYNSYNGMVRKELVK